MEITPEPAGVLGVVSALGVFLRALVDLALVFFLVWVFQPAASSSPTSAAAEVAAAAGAAPPLWGAFGVTVGEEGGAAAATLLALVVGSAAVEAGPGQFLRTCPTSLQAWHRMPSADQKIRCIVPSNGTLKPPSRHSSRSRRTNTWRRKEKMCLREGSRRPSGMGVTPDLTSPNSRRWGRRSSAGI